MLGDPTFLILLSGNGATTPLGKGTFEIRCKETRVAKRYTVCLIEYWYIACMITHSLSN